MGSLRPDGYQELRVWQIDPAGLKEKRLPWCHKIDINYLGDPLDNIMIFGAWELLLKLGLFPSPPGYDFEALIISVKDVWVALRRIPAQMITNCYQVVEQDGEEDLVSTMSRG